MSSTVAVFATSNSINSSSNGSSSSRSSSSSNLSTNGTNYGSTTNNRDHLQKRQPVFNEQFKRTKKTSAALVAANNTCQTAYYSPNSQSQIKHEPIQTIASSASTPTTSAIKDHIQSQTQSGYQIKFQEDFNAMRDRLFRLLSKVPIQVETFSSSSSSSSSSSCFAPKASFASSTSQQQQAARCSKLPDREPLMIKYYNERSLQDILQLHFGCSLIRHNYENGLSLDPHLATGKLSSNQPPMASRQLRQASCCCSTSNPSSNCPSEPNYASDNQVVAYGPTNFQLQNQPLAYSDSWQPPAENQNCWPLQQQRQQQPHQQAYQLTKASMIGSKSSHRQQPLPLATSLVVQGDKYCEQLGKSATGKRHPRRNSRSQQQLRHIITTTTPQPSSNSNTSNLTQGALYCKRLSSPQPPGSQFSSQHNFGASEHFQLHTEPIAANSNYLLDGAYNLAEQQQVQYQQQSVELSQHQQVTFGPEVHQFGQQSAAFEQHQVQIEEQQSTSSLYYQPIPSSTGNYLQPVCWPTNALCQQQQHQQQMIDQHQQANMGLGESYHEHPDGFYLATPQAGYHLVAYADSEQLCGQQHQPAEQLQAASICTVSAASQTNLRPTTFD